MESNDKRVTWSQSYGYDAAKRLTSIGSPAGTFSYAYDAVRNLQVSNLTLPSKAYITNRYDPVGRLLSTVLRTSGNAATNSHAYVYDTVGRRTWLTNVMGDYRGFTYDNIGELQTAIGKEAAGTSRLQEQLGYVYDAAGNLVRRTNNALVTTLTVTNLNELAAVSESGTLTVAGTTTGPATNVAVWGTPGLSYGTVTPYADNTWAQGGATLPNGAATYNASAKDSLGRNDTNTISVYLPNSATYAHDLNGNLTNDGPRTFVYDDENQLISVVVTNQGGASTRSDFSYDGLMRRRVRIEYAWSGGAWQSNQVVRYVYDGNLVIQERDRNNVPLVTYTRGRDLRRGLQSAGGIGGLLARTDNTLLTIGNSGAHAYYHSDANGNITSLLNTNQALVAKYLYDPFGNTLSQSGPLAAANLYRFSGKEFHLNSRLSYYLYRFYDSNLQRWLNRDPGGEKLGINLYGFVGNSPIRYYDPLGLTIGDWWDPRTWFNSGFTESWSDSANSIGQAIHGLATWNWDQIADAYDTGVLGQTQDAGWVTKYGTRLALTVATACTTAAAGVGTYEFVALENRSILVEGLLGGGEMGSGGILQLRVEGEPPIIRIDYHPISGGGNPVPHVDSPPLGWHHWPWQ